LQTSLRRSGDANRIKSEAGQSGTKRLVAKYGERLVCVRYRYDEKRRKRLKTVEIIVEEQAWQPKSKGFRRDETVGVRIDVKEKELQKRVREAGGRWNAKRKLWEMRYERAAKLGLKGRIRRLKAI